MENISILNVICFRIERGQYVERHLLFHFIINLSLAFIFFTFVPLEKLCFLFLVFVILT